jgi:hypothetical protein
MLVNFLVFHPFRRTPPTDSEKDGARGITETMKMLQIE